MAESVLVLSDEAVIAALVGMLIETTGYAAVFPGAREQPASALHRLRPVAVVLLDASMEAARSDLFFALAERMSVGVAVFGSAARVRAIGEIASDRQIPWLTLPADVDSLRRALTLARGKNGGRTRQQRRAAKATHTADGSCLLHDSEGRRWMVYDRRAAADRRSEGSPTSADRVFVREDGETRHCVVAGADIGTCSADALEQQLARSEGPTR